MDLRSSFNQVLQVCSGQEVAEVNEFTVLLVFNINNPPPILSPTNALPVNHNRAFGANYCERDHRPDLGVDLNLLIICLLGVEGVQADVVVNELGANLLFEREPLFHRQAVRLGNYRHYVHNLA